jgi:hypothetical protein
MMRSLKPSSLAFVLVTAVAITAVSALAFLSTGGDKAEAGPTQTIQVSNTKFCTPGQNPCPDSPLDTTVAADVGNTISFQLLGGTHTASQCTDGTFTACPGNLFDFGGGAGDWLIPGNVDNSNVYFRCNFHPTTMQGLIVVGSPASPTASETAAPTASPSPSPTASETAPPSETATPTASPLPTSTTTPTSTLTPAPTLSGRSDVNCDGETDGQDVLALLQHAAETAPAAAPLGEDVCAPIGSGEGDGLKGDLNCDGIVDARDALVALYGWAGISVPGLPLGCSGP